MTIVSVSMQVMHAMACMSEQIPTYTAAPGHIPRRAHARIYATRHIAPRTGQDASHPERSAYPGIHKPASQPQASTQSLLPGAPRIPRHTRRSPFEPPKRYMRRNSSALFSRTPICAKSERGGIRIRNRDAPEATTPCTRFGTHIPAHNLSSSVRAGTRRGPV